MKKNKIMPGLVAILVITALLAGCGGGNTTPPDTTTTPNTTTTTTTTSPTKSGDTLGEILGRAQNIVTMKYDLVMTTTVMTTPNTTTTTTTRTWVKRNKMRMEMSINGMASISIVDQDAKTMYTYLPAQNMAMKMSLDLAQKPATQEASSIMDYNPKIVGSETIDGQACQVTEYTIEYVTTKMWISKDRGLPVKSEITQRDAKTVMEYKNYDFSDIPDSMFELPPGVQIIQQ